MTMRPAPRLVSVVMPVRNALHTVPTQMAGLAGQDYGGEWELVVADCGSTDGSPEAILAHADRVPSLRLVTVPARVRNRAAAARNVGAAVARGDLLAFCDADDLVAPDWLRAIVRGARRGDLVAGALDTEGLNPAFLREWQRAPSWQRASPGYRFLPFGSSANLAIWSDVFTALRGFDETHPGAEDKDLSWRAQLGGYHLHEEPDAIVAYRYRAGLLGTARQRYRWGVAGARLYRDFAGAGLRSRSPHEILRAWAWCAVNAPAALRPGARRGRWTVRTAQQAGHLAGSLRERVLFL